MGGMAEYVCRYRFSLAQAITAPVLIGVSVWFVLAMIQVAREQPPGPTDGFGYVALFAGMMVLWGALAIVLGGAAVSWLAAMATRRVALRLDQDGVTLGRMAFPPTRLVRVPWHDIEDVVLFDRRRTGGYGWVSHIGLRLRPGAVRPPGVPTPGTLRALIYRLNAGREPWPADVYRVISGWDVDDTELARAVHTFAPHVSIA